MADVVSPSSSGFEVEKKKKGSLKVSESDDLLEEERTGARRSFVEGKMLSGERAKEAKQLACLDAMTTMIDEEGGGGVAGVCGGMMAEMEEEFLSSGSPPSAPSGSSSAAGSVPLGSVGARRGTGKQRHAPSSSDPHNSSNVSKDDGNTVATANKKISSLDPSQTAALLKFFNQKECEEAEKKQQQEQRLAQIPIRQEDVAYLQKELWMTPDEAQAELRKHGGHLRETVRHLVLAKPGGGGL